MKQSRSQKKDTMYGEAKLTERKTGKSRLETGAVASPYDMKEESNIADHSKPVTSSTLDEEQTTDMSKRVKNRVEMCSVYDVVLRTLAEQRSLSIREFLC